MRLKWKLFVASLKMLLRQREAVLWSLILPLFMILLFSFVRFDGIGRVELGIVDTEGTMAARVIPSLEGIAAVRLHRGTESDELEALRKGERDLVIVLPLHAVSASAATAVAYTNDAKPREAQLGMLIVQRVLDDLAFAQASSIPRLVLSQRSISSRHLTYFDFVAPGILSMSIMQLGIFGVAFGFVSMKKQGILRRLSVTPLNPNDFIIASVAMRLVLVMAQILILTLVPSFLLDLHFVGSFWEMFLVGMLGAIVFLAVGFTIAGVSRSEDQVAPLANVIAMPMIILSGVFFSRTSLPGILRSVVDFLPLSFLADAMRAIAIDGATLQQVWLDVLGLGIWCVLAVAMAVKLFRWE